METLYYIIPAVLILICVCPVFVKINCAYNLFDNRGAVGIYIFGVNLKSFMFKLNSNLSLSLFSEGERSTQEIDFESKETILVKNLADQVKNKTRLKLLTINYNIGLEDSFLTAMACGFINAVVLVCFTRIKSIKPTASLLLCDNVAFNEKVFQVALKTKISISLFDLVYSFINSVILCLKEEKT